MKENEVEQKPEAPHTALERKLRERLLLARAVPGDRLMLADATLLAALDGSRALTANERQALAQSPLTLRRLRLLSGRRRAAVPPAANDAAWRGSRGLLRAASDGAALDELVTDDACWSLHFLPEGGAWQVILKLAPEAPFAARLMDARPPLRVLDGAGAVILQGRLDADGEYECGWPFAQAPEAYFQQVGGAFIVEPAAG